MPYTSEQIVAARPAKNRVDASRPYAFLLEEERSAAGRVEAVAALFLTNRECPFRCLMCDLWRNTTDRRVPAGAIPRQIDYALARLPPARHIKLYNSGNFFDAQAIPPQDHAEIIRRVRHFATVIVENHPRLCGPRLFRFRDRLGTHLEVALGLETAHPAVLPLLNKQMTLADFDRAAGELHREGVSVRAFVLLRPPTLSEEEGVEWALRSIEHAFAAGAGCCSVIPLRGGNGMLERLAAEGLFSPPKLASLEEVLQRGLALGAGRVFADLWDVQRLVDCPRCGAARIERLRQMNLSQQAAPPVACGCRQ